MPSSCATRARFNLVRCSIIGLIATTFALPAQATQPVVNGGFESGTFAGWHVETHQAAGASPQSGAVVTSSRYGPYSGTDIGAPYNGTFGIVIDAPSHSSTEITQIVGLPKASQVSLSLWVNLRTPVSVSSYPSLDYTDPNSYNDQFRVDVLKAGASATSMASTDLLSAPLTSFTQLGYSPIFHVTYDLTALAGQTVKLRIAAVNSRGPLLLGVDDVTITPSDGIWTITDLGATAGKSVGLGLNGKGQVVGGASPSGNTQLQPFVWDSAEGMNLLTPSPALQQDSFASAINDSSQIAYTASTSGYAPLRAYLLSTDGSLTDLLQSLTPNVNEAHALNNFGTVVGSYVPDGYPSYWPKQSFLWSASSGASALLPETLSSEANGINDAGQVVGVCVSSETPSTGYLTHAFSWSPSGGRTDLDALNASVTSGAFGINTNGTVVGYRTVNGAWNNHHATVWSGGASQDLGTASPNYPQTVAYGVNRDGLIVGEGNNREQVYNTLIVPDFGFWAMLWQNGTPTALSTVIPAGTGWNLLTARGINDAGLIAGTGSINGQYHAYLLSPPVDTSSPGNILINGDFESGVLAPWNAYTIPDMASGGYSWPVQQGWTVASQTPFTYPSIDPIRNYTAFGSFDGGVFDPTNFTLQDPSDIQLFLDQPFQITTSVTTASLRFSYNIVGGPVWSGFLPRTFDVRLTDTSGHVLATVYSRTVPDTQAFNSQTVTVDVSGVLSHLGPGTYKLQFHQDIPQAYTGAGAIAIDDVALAVNHSLPVSPARLLQGVTSWPHILPPSGTAQVTLKLMSAPGVSTDPNGNPADGVYVRLSSDSPDISFGDGITTFNGSPYVFVPQWANSAVFTVNCSSFATTKTSATIYASLQGDSVSLNLPVVATVATNVILSQYDVYGGEGFTGLVALSEPASYSLDPSGQLVSGAYVVVTTNSPAQMGPDLINVNGLTYVHIPQGETTATFTVQTTGTTTDVPDSIYANFNNFRNDFVSIPFTIHPYPAPAITSLNPAIVTVTPDPITLTINGSGFTNETAVAAFGGSFTPSSVTPTQLVVTLPAGVAAAAGTVNISVNNPMPIGGSSNTLPLTVTSTAVSSLKTSVGSTTAPIAVTGTVTLTAAAPAGGLPVAISSSNSAAGVPSSVIVAAGKTTATFTITPAAVDADTPVTITAAMGAVSKTAALTVKAAVLATLTAPASMNGGTSAVLTVALTGNAGPSGVAVALSSSDSTAIASGTSVNVLPGAKSANLTFKPAAVTSDQTITLTASQGGVVKTASVLVKAPVIGTLAASPSPIAGGAALTIKVGLSSPAPAAGLSIPVTSSASAVPSTTVSIPAGATAGSATVVTSIVSSDTTSTLTATLGASTKTASVTVLGAALKILTAPASLYGGTTGVVTVSLTGKAGASGVIIALSSSDGTTIPPGTTITVPSGGLTGSYSITPAPVTVDKNVTITATQAGVVKTAPTTIKAAVLTSLAVSANPIAGGGNLTVKATLSSPAPAAGLSIPVASSSAAVPSGTIPVAAGATSGTFLASTLTVDADTPVTLTGTLGAVSKTAAVTVLAAQLKAVTVPASIYGGTATTLTVSLTGKAGPSGMPVALSSSDGTTIAPGTVLNVPAGAMSASLSITPTPVPADTSITITASAGATVKTAPMLVKAPAVTLFAASPVSVKGGHPSTLTITLNAPAPAGGLTFPLTSNSAVIAPNPAYITVAAGAKTGTLVVTPGTVTASTPVVLTETFNGVSKTVTVTVTP